MLREDLIALAKKNNKDSRIAREHIDAWYYSSATDLSDVYGRYSPYKAQAFENWKRRCYDELKGNALCIISANSQIFTLGFYFKDDDDKRIFVYVTPCYIRCCYM